MKKQFIAAVAGSAGSHERLIEFFDYTPHDDVSYVILQHLPALWQSQLAPQTMPAIIHQYVMQNSRRQPAV